MLPADQRWALYPGAMNLNRLMRSGFTRRQASTLVDEVAADVAEVGGGGGGGGGGGLTLGLATLAPAAVSQNVSAGGKLARFDAYGVSAITGSVGTISSGAASYGFDFTDAGWYQLTFRLWLGFTAGSDPLPEFARLEWYTYEGAELGHDIALSAPGTAIGLAGSRSVYGGAAAVAGPIFYTPGAGVTGGGADGNAVNLGWSGDATLVNGNGGSANAALSVQAVKVS